MSAANVVWRLANVTHQNRNRIRGHRSAVVGFTGLSGAGKSMLAQAVEQELYRSGCRILVFDGDDGRHGLCFAPGLSLADRLAVPGGAIA